MGTGRSLAFLLALLLLSMLWGAAIGPAGAADYPMELTGFTQGTTYSVKYISREPRNHGPEIDALLNRFSQCLSTYLPDSEISRFNRGTSHRFASPFFYPVLQKAREVHRLTGGAFDPTVLPLAEAYGFGPDRQPPRQVPVDSLLPYVGFDLISFDATSVRKSNEKVRLDVNALAQGYAVDVVSEFLESRGVRRYLVEIGGEVRCRGKNENGQTWTIGIENPAYGESYGGPPLQTTVRLWNRSLATSGHYRNTQMVDGQRRSHILHPKTGLPVPQALLSVTVFARDCMTADAYATAFMVMGLEKALNLMERTKGLGAYFIYRDDRGNVRTIASGQIGKKMRPAIIGH